MYYAPFFGGGGINGNLLRTNIRPSYEMARWASSTRHMQNRVGKNMKKYGIRCTYIIIMFGCLIYNHLRKMVYKGCINLLIDRTVYHFITSKKFISNHLYFLSSSNPETWAKEIVTLPAQVQKHIAML